MSANSPSVQEAINRGIKAIDLPLKIILMATIILCSILMTINFSWWYLLLLPLGFTIAQMYSGWACAKWRLWAYEHIADIHQLQRSAELAGILMRQSYNKTSVFLNNRQNEKLKEMQKRFSEEVVFVDDSSIPKETVVYAKSLFTKSRKPIIIINDYGIKVESEQIIEWDKIYNERVALVSFMSKSPRTNTVGPAGKKSFFRFECPQGRYEKKLSSLAITGWKLELLLYTYRGRYLSDTLLP